MKKGNESERMVWIFGILAMTCIATPPLGFIVLVIAIGGFWYFKRPKNWNDFVLMFFALPKQKKVLLGVLMGGFIGTFMGIAAMGNAIAATLPLALLMGYLVHVNTPEHFESGAETKISEEDISASE